MLIFFYRLQLNIFSLDFKYLHFKGLIFRLFENQPCTNYLANYDVFRSKFYNRSFNYSLFFWKFYFLKNLFLKIGAQQRLSEVILLYTETITFFSIILFFAFKYNQAYALGWFKGFLSNQRVLRSHIYERNLSHLYNIKTSPRIILICENVSPRTNRALLELAKFSTSLLISLVAYMDEFNAEVIPIFTTKTKLKIFFYLNFFFSCLFFKGTNFLFEGVLFPKKPRRVWLNAKKAKKHSLLKKKSKIVIRIKKKNPSKKKKFNFTRKKFRLRAKKFFGKEKFTFSKKI